MFAAERVMLAHRIVLCETAMKSCSPSFKKVWQKHYDALKAKYKAAKR